MRCGGVHRSENKQERESEIGKQDGRRGVQMNVLKHEHTEVNITAL